MMVRRLRGEPGGAEGQSMVQGSMFQVRAPRILSFEGYDHKGRRTILRFVQGSPQPFSVGWVERSDTHRSFTLQRGD